MKNNESLLKKWLDRFLIVDFFILIIGSIWFLFSIIFYFNGYNKFFELFYKLWMPLFLPAITIFIVGILTNIFIAWWHREELD